jgi:hypothetical protein
VTAIRQVSGATVSGSVRMAMLLESEVLGGGSNVRVTRLRPI